MTHNIQLINLVREYIALIDNIGRYSAHQLLKECARLLPLIYSYGITLPDVEPTDEGSEFNITSPMGEIVDLLGSYDVYSEVFDPVTDKDAIASSLSDDLADIYQDLKGPLLNYDEGHQSNAIWQWRFNICGHCGNHIVDALRPIHRLVNDHMGPDYISKN